MTDKERKLALYCLKASSNYHSEVCEECIKYPNCDHMGQDDVTETIIKALEQEPCEDAISRKQAIYVASGYCHPANVAKELAKLSSVNSQPKTGHWIRITNGAMKEKYICSECARQIEDDGIEGLLTIKYPYCHCGAKMVEVQESEVQE